MHFQSSFYAETVGTSHIYIIKISNSGNIRPLTCIIASKLPCAIHRLTIGNLKQSILKKGFNKADHDLIDTTLSQTR